MEHIISGLARYKAVSRLALPSYKQEIPDGDLDGDFDGGEYIDDSRTQDEIVDMADESCKRFGLTVTFRCNTWVRMASLRLSQRSEQV